MHSVHACLDKPRGEVRTKLVVFLAPYCETTQDSVDHYLEWQLEMKLNPLFYLFLCSFRRGVASSASNNPLGVEGVWRSTLYFMLVDLGLAWRWRADPLLPLDLSVYRQTLLLAKEKNALSEGLRLLHFSSHLFSSLSPLIQLKCLVTGCI